MEKCFSFVIPHKNSPDLLQRCIRSIPDREDYEIIVIDDNSDENKKPIIERNNVKIIFLDANTSKGAGHARNVGLDYIQGKWALFPDADDSYTDELTKTLEAFQYSDFDVIYFGHNTIKDDSVQKVSFGSLDPHLSKENIYKIKYSNHAPWDKIVSVNFLKKNNIRFEECPVGNDILFSYHVSYLAKDNFSVISPVLYNYYINPTSITHKKKHDASYYLTICKHLYQRNEFLVFIGQEKHTRSMVSKLLAILLKKGVSQFALTVRVLLSKRKEIRESKNFFLNSILNK